MRRIEIGVIDPAEEQQTLLAWAQRIDAGEPPSEAVPQLNFASYAQLHSALTDKRMALLEYVAQHEGLGIRQLAAAIGRNYRNVYDDVQSFIRLGLMEKRDNGLFAPYDEIDIRKTLRKAA